MNCSNINAFQMSDRLSGGNSRSEGRVEVYHDRKWGTICDRGWDLIDAGIFCRMLAYAGARATPKYGQGSGPIWLSDVKCIGTEDSLFRCENAGWGNVDNCDHSNDAGAECYYDWANAASEREFYADKSNRNL